MDTGSKKHFHDLEFRGKRSSSFANHAGKSHYPDEFLKLMSLALEMTILDMGCGGGSLVVPLASKVKKVTAVDFSPNMLAIVKNICRERSIIQKDGMVQLPFHFCSKSSNSASKCAMTDSKNSSGVFASCIRARRRELPGKPFERHPPSFFNFPSTTG